MAIGERFCGQCGTPRLDTAQSDRARAGAPTPFPVSNWKGKEIPAGSNTAPVSGPKQPPVAGIPSDELLAEALEQQFPDLFLEPDRVADRATIEKQTAAEPPVNPEAPSELSLHTKQELEVGANDIVFPEMLKLEEETAQAANRTSDELAVATVPPKADWSSAAAAREFLEQVSSGKQRSALGRFWDTRRGDIYLAIAVILVAFVIRWGIWSNHPVSATAAPVPPAAAAQHKAPDADLSMFDRMLISLGLAEAPEVPEDKGNPSTQVWVDLRTALYYCPGNDAYGKTPKGKFMTQRDAQLDSYEPAYRKTCK
jgi:hypothetical protein